MNMEIRNVAISLSWEDGANKMQIKFNNLKKFDLFLKDHPELLFALEN